MRRSNTQPLSEILDEVLEMLHIRQKIKEMRIINAWEETLGKSVAGKTEKIYIKDRTLFVHLSSSIVRNELFMMKEKIVLSLNEKAGEKIIDRIILR
jgi:predicted nucleic acid-binding Zn ribbon protein